MTAPRPHKAARPADSLASLCGVFRVASRTTTTQGKDELLTLGILRAFRSSLESDAPNGQWAFWFDEHLELASRCIVIEAAARLGLVPVHFSAEFENRLRDPHPVCLVSDTNTLYHGSLFQALALRSKKATHVALADQVLMELQKQRETAYVGTRKRSVATASDDSPLTSVERWTRAARRASFIAAGGRTLRRIRAAGHIVHVARPPDAMVRYFGGGRQGGENEAGGTDDDADVVGSNALRDRLILESAIQQRVAVPDVPVWLLTDDALLAAQAALEGVNVGFAWLPPNPPRFITSPFFSARSLQLHHVSVAEFVDELLWSTGNILLQRAGEAQAFAARLSSEKRARVLSEMGEVGHGIAWSWETAATWSLAASVPQKAPSAKAIVAVLLTGLDGAISAGSTEAERYSFQYLEALGWSDSSGSLSARGRSLAKAWLELSYADADAWAEWIDDAGRDLRKLAPFAAAFAELRKNGVLTDAELAERLGGGSGRSIAAQMSLASALGGVVRLATKNRLSGEWPAASAEQTVIEAIRTLIASASAGVSAVNVGRVFSYLQRPESPAMPFHVFRRALVHLERDDRVVLSGSVPNTEAGVSIHILMPSSSGEENVTLPQVSIGSGAHIVVGRSARVVELRGGSA